jgi:hypothetical protein
LNSIARMQGHERAELFAETAARKGIADAIVEKDFWVCWMLQQLFSIDALSGRLLFKGGTSLSKVFHAINRFSEDIDLAVDYAALGFVGDRDPRRGDISKTKRATILAEMMDSCQRYIGTEFIQALDKRCRELLGPPDAWSLGVSEQDANVVRFRYPGSTAKSLTYVPPQVVLELGTHAEFVPHDRFTIRSFAAEEFPNVVSDGDVGVVALLAKRTFWEKATILHAEYHRPLEKLLPERYSRHYYDVAMMAEGQIRADALSDMDMLALVVKHKETFYPAAWAQYDLARPGTLRLVPRVERMAALERDYRNMSVMLFGEVPPFGAVIEALTDLERQSNR